MKLYLETSALLRAALQQQREVTQCMRRATAWVTSALTSDRRVNDNATALGITVWYFPLEPAAP